jgi:hypothetical protein
MDSAEHLPADEWKYNDSEAYHFFPRYYRGAYILEVRWREAKSDWLCAIRSTDYDNNYREGVVPGSPGDPWPAMQKCYEIADQWAG